MIYFIVLALILIACVIVVIIKHKENLVIGYWYELKEKAMNGSLTTDEFVEHIAKQFKDKHYKYVEKLSKQGLKIIKGMDKIGIFHIFFYLEDVNLNQEKFADVKNFIESEKSSCIKLYYISQRLPKQTFTNLFKKSIIESGVRVYNANVIIEEANSALESIYFKKSSKFNKNDIKKKQNFTYDKIFPHMMSSDDDSKELQEQDDMMVIDTIDDDFHDMF